MRPWHRREPERLPAPTAAVRDARRAIDLSTAEDAQALVLAFLGAAWPTVEAQNQ